MNNYLRETTRWCVRSLSTLQSQVLGKINKKISLGARESKLFENILNDFCNFKNHTLSHPQLADPLQLFISVFMLVF
jgi:hypothetical protein